MRRWDGIGDLDDKVRWRAVVQCISTARLAAVQVGAVVGAHELVRAVLLQTHGTVGTIAQTTQA